MNKRKTLVSLDNFVTGGLLLLIFLFMNLTVSDSTIATDFSGSGYYTLQEPTIKLLKGTDDLLKIDYYYSPNLTPRTAKYMDLRQKVSSLLRLYDQYGGSNVRVNIIDPTDGARQSIPSDVRDRLEAEGVVPVVEEVEREGGTSSEFNFYSSIKITYRANNRVINKVTDVENLEYMLSQEIQYAMTPELVKIGMYVAPQMRRSRRRGRRRSPRGGGGLQRTEDTRSFSSLERKLKKIGIVERIFLEKGDHFPDPRKDDSIDVLLVLANRKVPESDLYALDQYIMRGGKAIIAADPVGKKPSTRRSPFSRGGGERQGFLYSGPSSGKTLLDLLEKYGVKGSGSVTIDRSEAKAQIPVRREKTITFRGQTRRVEMREFVWSELPFFYKASPSRSLERPAFVDRVGDPLVLFPMTFQNFTKDEEASYIPWFTTSNSAVELDPPSGPGRSQLGSFVQNAVEYNFDRDQNTDDQQKPENESGSGKKKSSGSEQNQEKDGKTTGPQKKRRDLVVSLKKTFSSAFKKNGIPKSMTSSESDQDQKNGDTGTDTSENDSGKTLNKQQGDSDSGQEDPEKKEADDKQTSDSGKKKENRKHVTSSPESEIVFVGDTDIFKISQMDRYRGRLFKERVSQSPNETFATGVVNYITRSDDDELDLKSERILTPRLASFGPIQEMVFSVLLIVLAPMLVILFGIVRWTLVQSGRKQVQIQQQMKEQS